MKLETKVIKFTCGENIDSAYKKLQENQPAQGTFNQKILYSSDSLDECYKKVIGVTKEEFNKKIQEEQDAYEKQKQEHLEKIPELIKVYREKARGVIPEDKLEIWDNMVPIRLKDLYQGMELDCWLDLISIFNDESISKEKRLEKAKKKFYKQGHSGFSGSFVLGVLRGLHPFGEEFYNNMNIL